MAKQFLVEQLRAAIAPNKPPNASDILTLDQAKNEIINNRKLIILYNQHLKAVRRKEEERIKKERDEKKRAAKAAKKLEKERLAAEARAKEEAIVTPVKLLPGLGITTPLDKMKATLAATPLQDDETPVCLVNFGNFNPPHFMHSHMFEVAREYLRKKTKFVAVGGFYCPTHDKMVQQANRGRLNQAIPGRHRAQMCKIMAAESPWVDVSVWEVTRAVGYLDHPTILTQISTFLHQHVGANMRTMYLCGADHLIRTTSEYLKSIGCVCVTRYGHEQELADALAGKYKGFDVHVADDQTIMLMELVTTSSTKIRRLLANGDMKEAKKVLTPGVFKYVKKNKLGPKISGKGPTRWTDADRKINEAMFASKKDETLRLPNV